MSERNPTRAALLELQDERRAMHEGYVFLDEKCLLLAGEMLRQLGALARLQATVERASEAAAKALQDAIGRHGLEELQLLPRLPQDRARGQVQEGALMGVKLKQATWVPDSSPAPATVADSPEARDARAAFVALAQATAPLAAVHGNLERLSHEYRRSVRRARALQDVLLPELAREVTDIETRIEELEQQDAIAMRHGALRR